jgi:hypothetical protein
VDTPILGRITACSRTQIPIKSRKAMISFIKCSGFILRFAVDVHPFLPGKTDETPALPRVCDYRPD